MKIIFQTPMKKKRRGEGIDQEFYLQHCTIWPRHLDTKKIRAEILERFKIWCLRAMEKIKWSEHIGEKRTLLNNVLLEKSTEIDTSQEENTLKS